MEFCGCKSCHRLHGHKLPRRDICFYHLGVTLTQLILILAHIDVDETLQPASTGLLMLYERIVKEHIVRRKAEFSREDSLSRRENDIDNTYRRTFELFTGLPSHYSVHKLGAASAICHGGVCIWLPALENPLYDPIKQLGLRVVSGKVNFRGRLYREIVHMEEDMEEDKLKNGVNSIMRRIAAHGTTRGSTLVVRETVDASRLDAWIELRSGKTSSAFNTYLDHIGVKRPRQLPSELKLHIRKLYDNLHEKIQYRTCEVNLGRARSQGLPKPDMTTWERPCPQLAALLESTIPAKRSYNYPEAGEWVVVITDPNHGAPIVRILRGDSTLLYYVASLRFREVATYVSYFDGCIRCLASSIAIREAKHDDLPPYSITCDGCRFEISKLEGDDSWLIEIHTITENECMRWSAKMTGFYAYASVEHNYWCRDNRIRVNNDPLDDDTSSSDSTETSET